MPFSLTRSLLAVFGIVATTLVATCAVAVLFYLVPSLRLWRGVEAIALLTIVAGVVLARLVYQEFFNS